MNLLMISPVEDSIPTRYTLLSRLHDWDDQESWRVFFDTYWRLIYSVAIRSGLNEAEAQDVGRVRSRGGCGISRAGGLRINCASVGVRT